MRLSKKQGNEDLSLSHAHTQSYLENSDRDNITNHLFRKEILELCFSLSSSSPPENDYR